MADSDIKIVGLSSSKSSGKTNWKIISAIIGIVVLSIGIIAGIVLVRQNQNINEEAAGNCDNPATIVQCPRSDGAIVTCNPPDQNNNAQIQLCNRVGRIEMCGVGSSVRQYCCPAIGGTWTTDMTACAVVATATASPTASPTIRATSTATTQPAQCGVGLSCSLSSTVTGTTACTQPTDSQTLVYCCPTGKTIVGGACVTSATSTATATSRGTATATATAKGTATATSTSKATASSKATATAIGMSKATSTAKGTATAKASASPTAFPVPETGMSLPTILGTGFGVIMILVSLALAL